MGNLMADFLSESFFQSDNLCQRHICSSFFGISGLFEGFSSKGLSDSDSLRSPTSPLDFSFFSNLSNPFSLRSSRSSSSSQNGLQRRWDYSKVGLSIINSLMDEAKPSGKVLDSSRSKNIVFGPQMKTNVFPSTSNHYYESNDSIVNTNSLPSNNMSSKYSLTKSSNPQLGSSNVLFGVGGVQLEPEPIKKIAPDSGGRSSSLTSLIQYPNSSSKNNYSENRNTIMNPPPVIGVGSQLNKNSLGINPISLPIPVGSGHGLVSCLSAREIELSEDYTCIISYGPNPKTTHIFGDYILECHTNELANFDEDGRDIKLPQVAKRPEDSTPHEFLSFCYLCKKKLEEGKDIYMYRGDKAFCSLKCRSLEILAEEEMEKSVNNSSISSPESSYHEDLFIMGLPVVT